MCIRDRVQEGQRKGCNIRQSRRHRRQQVRPAGFVVLPGADQDSPARPTTEGSQKIIPRVEERYNHHRPAGGLDDL
eukprot:7805220-Lingulodinium_polyedra.AAC.1